MLNIIVRAVCGCICKTFLCVHNKIRLKNIFPIPTYTSDGHSVSENRKGMKFHSVAVVFSNHSRLCQ